MVNLKNMSSKLVTINLRKVIVILGCLFFLFSIILPFYHQIFYYGNSMIEESFYYSTYYWSFRVSRESGRVFTSTILQSTDYWFYQPAFYDFFLRSLLYNVLVAIFVAQLLTLATAIASVFYDRRILAFAPLALCSLVTVLMIYTNIILLPSNFLLDSYLLGYWFTYPAILMFLISFILDITSRKRSSTYTRTPTLTQ
jgi:hypothetical protein